ncbi:MAG: hypothetical protein IJX77_04820 [Ruminococcus sp.]|nr:hypothetical protein [Ruminococcus sp.]
MKSSHAGHRERLRRKLFQLGADELAEHEVLELMLFHVFPRQNTNELAHDLLEKFGSIAGVFEADNDAVTSLKGIGNSSVTFIKFMRDLCRYYANSPVKSFFFKAQEDINKYLMDYFSYHSSESLAILSISSQMELYQTIPLPADSLLPGKDAARSLTEFVLLNNLNKIIIGRNYLNKPLIPSSEDYAALRFLMDIFEPLNIAVYDYIICNETGSFSLRQHGAFSFSSKDWSL